VQNVRIQAVRYLNTIPLIAGLDKVAGLSLSTTVPSRIAEAVSGGEADIGLVSAVDLVRAPVPLAALPVSMIGCEGPTLTVRVFSAVPMEQVRTIHADTDSRTSVALARMLITRRAGQIPDIAAFDAREWMSLEPADRAEWPDTVLLIGDKVVTDAPSPIRYPHQLDLGEAWHAWTGLPFVYALWACRADRTDDPKISTAIELLDRQRRRNRMRLDHIVSREAARLGWPDDLARDYVGRLLRYEVTEPARRGLERFMAEAFEAGLVQDRSISWASAAPARLGASIAS